MAIKIQKLNLKQTNFEKQSPFDLPNGIYDLDLQDQYPGPFLVFGAAYAKGFCSLNNLGLYWRRDDIHKTTLTVRVLRKYDADIALTEKE